MTRCREDVCNFGFHCIEDGLAITTSMIEVGLAIARSRMVDKALGVVARLPYPVDDSEGLSEPNIQTLG